MCLSYRSDHQVEPGNLVRVHPAPQLIRHDDVVTHVNKSQTSTSGHGTPDWRGWLLATLGTVFVGLVGNNLSDDYGWRAAWVALACLAMVAVAWALRRPRAEPRLVQRFINGLLAL